MADTALNPEQHYDLQQQFRQSVAAVGRLNISLRGAMTTWMERECSTKELAQTLGLSLPAVKARLHRARKKISRSLASGGRTANHGSMSRSRRKPASSAVQNRGIPSYD